MGYDFSVHTPKNVSTTSVAVPERTTPVRESRDAEVERTVLYGTDIRECNIPHDTMSRKYKVAFENASHQTWGLDDELLSQHMLLLGGIGSGKTNVFNFLIEALQSRMTSEDVMIIFDTKGDFKKKFYQSNNASHWLIGNDEEYRYITRSWNIFDEMKDADGSFSKNSELIAKEIAKQLFVGRESPSQPFFSQAATDLVSKVIIHLMRQAVHDHTENMLDTETLVDFLQEADMQQYYEMLTSPFNKDFASALFYIGKPGEKMTPQALGVLGHINAMVNDLFVGVFAQKRPAGSFSMKDIIREKNRRTIFVEYDLSVGETLGPMYRLMFDLALKEALGGRQNNRGNVYLIIDEFKLLPNLMHIDDALNFGRSLGVKVCAGLQSINQLYSIYGEDRGKVLASGFSNCICFRTFDLDSRKYITERFGEKYELLAYHSRKEPIAVQRNGYVVEDWNILDLQPGEAYVSLVGYKPFFFGFRRFEDAHAVL